MMVDRNEMECEAEDVSIGNWNSRLPSDICSNQEIFDEIFSIETWNKILEPDQRERILKFLPPDVSSNSELARQTIEELLNGTLTTFSRSPLKRFYEKLEQGQYDPEVMSMKSNIMSEWRKESLRQLKSYHAKLLEDIIVSRQKYLSRVKGRSGCISSSTPNSFKHRRLDCHVLPRVQTTEITPSNNSVKQLVNKDYASVQRTPTVKIGNKRNLTDRRSISPESEHTSAKLSKTSSNVFTVESNQYSTNLNQSEGQHSNSLTTAKPDINSFSDSPSSCIYLLKNNQSKSISTESFTASQVQPIVTLMEEEIVPVGNSEDDGQKSIRLPYTSSNHTENSPILASHLQGTSDVSGFEIKSDQTDEPDSHRITLNYCNKVEDKSSEDDLETSSDEFEAIEPTIGFGISIPSSGVVDSSPLKATDPSRKIQIVKKQPNPLSQPVLINNQALVTLASDYCNTKSAYASIASSILIVNTSNSLGQAITTSSNLKPLELQPHHIVNFNSDKVESSATVSQPPAHVNTIVPTTDVVKRVPDADYFSSIDLGDVPAKEHISSKASTSSESTINQATSFPCARQSLLSNASVSFCKVDLQTKNLAEAGFSAKNTISNQPSTYSVANTISNQPSTYSVPNKCQGLTNSYIHTANPSFRLTVLPSSDIVPLSKMLPGAEKQVMFSPSTDETDAETFGHEGLRLNIGTLNNPTTGMNVSLSGIGSSEDIIDPDSTISMKMEIDVAEKIDDLSVLDGNPFDSIPNLSDELDGLDLDLVDGLCDFEILLSEEKKYPSFFCLIRDVLCSTKDHRMNLLCMEKTISKWCASSGAAHNSWFLRVSDWNTALVTALNFLAGSYQDVHPEDFVPYIEYKYKTKYYQWIGAGRDSDNNLTSLCSVWMDNLDRLPSIKKVDGETEDQDEDDEENDDSELAGEDSKKKNKRPQTPPPPRFVTDWSVRQSTEDEKSAFRKQERSRFENPHKAFTYKMHGYESVVGPVKGVYSSQVGMTNKARGHSLLVDDRPPYVTILALVRDAVARLPNGEGTRSDICEMLRDSAFLAPDASNVTLNSVVSGALDRLHYERDPCVRYDSHKKSWIYLHRDRTQDQFERLHHNRSYTKSTKCRNSGSRKPRKGVTKSQTLLQPSISPTTGTSVITAAPSFSNSTMNTATSPSQGDSEGSLSKSFKNSASSIIPKTLVIVDNNKQNAKLSTTTESSTGIQCSADPTATSASVNSVSAKPLISELSKPIQFSNSFVSPVLKGPSRQLILQTTDVPVGSIQTQNSMQIRAIRPIPVSNTPTTTCIYGSPFSNQALTTSSTTNTLTQGQFLLGPSTMLRLANTLRMSPFRLQGSTNAQNSTVRLPQHRILLTRGAVPVSSQTQGVLLGQTSCGQTVILSTTASGAINGLQAVGSISARQYNEASHRALYTSNAAPITIASKTANTPVSPSYDPSQSIRLTCINSGVPITHTNTSRSKPMTVLNTKTVGIGSTTSLINALSCSPPEAVSNLSPAELSLANFNNDSHNLEAYLRTDRTEPVPHSSPKPVTSISSTVPISVVPTPHNQTQISHRYEPVCEVQTNSNQLCQTPMTSPIIIRSTQGEFVIPGHISLSRGVQGIKLVPLPMGNKTVLAKIIPNNPGSRMTLGTAVNKESSGVPLVETSRLTRQ